MAGRFAHPKFRSFLADGTTPNASGKVYVYETGTTTETNSYTDRGAGTPNANPVILDSAGEANIWLPSGAQYTIKIDTSADVQLSSTDGISSNDLSTWVISGSNIYYSAGDVYIGASSGSETLDVTGTCAISSTLAVTGVATFTAAAVFNGGLTSNGSITLGAADDLIGSSTSDININSNTFLVSGASGSLSLVMSDNLAVPFSIAETSNNYIACSTVNSSEFIKFGNATTNPTVTFQGTGAIIMDGGYVQIKEITTPSATASYGALYTKSDNALYFQDGAGVEHTVTIS